MEKQPFDDFVIYEKVGNPKTNIYGRSMVSSNNNSRVNNENGRSSDISLEEALKITSYPNYLKDFIKQFLIDNYSDNDMAKIFLIKDNEKIFVIEYALTIELNGRNYKVYVLVYLPILFPNYPPEFYIEKTASLGLNKFYNGKISVPDFKINLESFVKFDPNKNNIEEIINNLVINFTQEFPIYKDNGINNNLNTSAKCILEKSKTSKVILPKRQNNYSRQISYNNNNSNNNGLGRSYQNNYDNVKTEKFIDNKDEFTDKTFLDFIRKQTKDIIRYNYLEFKEKHNFGANMDKLKILQENVNHRLNNGNIYGKNDQLKSRFQTLKNIKAKLEVIENNLNNEINDIKNNDNKSFFDKFDEIVNVKNQKDLEYLAKIKDMEDYLVYLKKGYEKNVVSFNDMVINTRMLSREIFSIDYLRKQRKNY